MHVDHAAQMFMKHGLAIFGWRPSARGSATSGMMCSHDMTFEPVIRVWHFNAGDVPSAKDRVLNAMSEGHCLSEEDADFEKCFVLARWIFACKTL
jgi:hypothetical protein